MTNLLRFHPSTSIEGGTAVGNSYLCASVACPRKWYYSYFMPSGEAGECVGIQPKKVSNFLLTGRVFHEGLAAWYNWGCEGGEIDNGSRNLQEAIEIAEHVHAEVYSQYLTPTIADDDLHKVRDMLIDYHEEFGPDGREPEYPQYQVAFDDKGPLIERTFVIPLEYKDYNFTTQPDIIMWRDGFLVARDHKTSSTGFGAVGKRLKKTRLDTQFVGEYLALTTYLSDQPLDGVEINVVVKERRQKKTCKYKAGVRSDVFGFSEKDLKAYRLECIHALRGIDQGVTWWHNAVEKGHGLEDAADIAFPRHGMRVGTCEAYRDGCEFRELCENKDRVEELIIENYVARKVEDVDREVENPK
ncbi:MAG: PD-(D/E)XK nuclease family protein [Desulfobacteraceae bacterium]|nr:PD-(D/E)XK nuclease family protein [Desulfobacteraceae bacterium]